MTLQVILVGGFVVLSPKVSIGEQELTLGSASRCLSTGMDRSVRLPEDRPQATINFPSAFRASAPAPRQPGRT